LQRSNRRQIRHLAQRSAPEESELRATPGEEGLFAAAMAGVEPLVDRERATRRRAPRGTAAARVRQAAAMSGDEALARGVGPGRSLHVAWAGEQVEGLLPGVSRRQLAELRRAAGGLERAAILDLHGTTRAEARVQLERFLSLTAAAGRRRICIICGRGRHSSTGQAVLREAVVEWLAGPLAGLVRAFCSAPERAGGTGALCVLLRRTGAR
jgi:DNA-nicking Smr family endonuclease